jgi:Tfp pilus tip-associated adhesin PilY1
VSTASEYQSVIPIVGTVNLEGASSATNVTLPNTSILRKANCVATSDKIPQRSNMILTSAFTLPDFEGRLRAFRTYAPEEDCTKPAGWKFVADGTPLWPDLDGRPSLAGLARVPSNSNSRNIYTRVPVNGTWTTVAFTTDAANVTALSPYLGGADASVLIPYVRGLPLGAVIGSTPAIMDAPSQDPPPDDDYGREDVAGSFADNYKGRRSIIWVGGNNGMIHGIDARTGYEVWAFIPFNLLPKLRSLLDGQSMNRMDYFVDSSPKIAELKINYNGTHQWRSVLIIGQGAGGTFYQAFDVTEAGMGVSANAGSITDVESLLDKFDDVGESDQRARFLWAFPDYSHFDTTTTTTVTVNDGTTDEMTFYGELSSASTAAERTVGFTWSDPAVGPLTDDRTTNTVVVGSGYFPNVESQLPYRSTTLTAGAAIYLINVETGQLVGNPAGSCSGTGCLHVGDSGGSTPKNALQADPTAATDYGQHTVKRAYMGDLDGKYWKFNFTEAGAITSNQMIDTNKPIYGSSALLLVGTVNQYMFFSTGSDLLPSTATNATGTFKLYGIKDNGTSGTQVFSRDLSAVSNSSGLATGERPSSSPSVAGDIVFFTTTTESGSAPCSEFSGKLYGLTYLGGTAYDTNSTAGIQNNESPVIATVSGRATAPFIVDQHLYFGGTGNSSGVGSLLQAFGDPEDFNNGVGQVGVRILSWREIR